VGGFFNFINGGNIGDFMPQRIIRVLKKIANSLPPPALLNMTDPFFVEKMVKIDLPR
jgi:hypothetical protein